MSVTRAWLLLGIVCCLALACRPSPTPYEARDVTVTLQGCHQALVNWNSPDQTPSQFRIEVHGRTVATVGPGVRSRIVHSWWSVADGPVLRVKSLIDGAVVATTPPVSFTPPACNVKPVLTTLVVLVNLMPPVGDPTPWTFYEVEDFFFGASESVAATLNETSLGRQTLDGDVTGYWAVNGADHCTWSDANGQFSQCATGSLFAAAIAAADPWIDFSVYDRVALLFSGMYTGGASYPLGFDTDEGLVAAYHAPYNLGWPVLANVSLHLHELGHLALSEEPVRHGLGHAGTVSGCTDGRFPVDPTNPEADCTVSNGEIEPMSSFVKGTPSLQYSALHKERAGYLDAGRVRVIDRWRSVITEDIDLRNSQEPISQGYQLIRVRLAPFGYDFALEYRNEILRDGTGLRGVMIRLATPDRGLFNEADSLMGSDHLGRMLVLNEGRPVFDDPNHDVRVEWLSDLSGQGASVRIGASSGTPAP